MEKRRIRKVCYLDKMTLKDTKKTMKKNRKNRHVCTHALSQLNGIESFIDKKKTETKFSCYHR